MAFLFLLEIGEGQRNPSYNTVKTVYTIPENTLSQKLMAKVKICIFVLQIPAI